MQLSAISKGPLSGAVGVKRSGSSWPASDDVIYTPPKDLRLRP
jgi:hypothetical protein